jgi:hypothetical protein
MRASALIGPFGVVHDHGDAAMTQDRHDVPDIASSVSQSHASVLP